MKSFRLVLLVFIFVPCATFAQIRHEGEINGSRFIIDVPPNASGDVLFLARGYRPEALPLSAVYEQGTEFFQSLLAEGWTIASPSFGGNRWIMEDGAKDIIALRKHLHAEILTIERAFIYGETMGGGILALMAETYPDGFNGAISLGAHHYAEAQGNVPEQARLADYLPGDPKFPILLLSNEGEARGSRLYAERAKHAQYPPVLWTVSRSGHVNINSAERLSAFRAVVAWSETGQLPVDKSAMQVMQRSSTAAIKDGVAGGNITRLRPLYGNIYTSFVADDLDTLNVQLGDRFAVTHGQQRVYPIFATAYSDVGIGEWVAFIDPESYLQISRNYANATETLNAQTGDALLISNETNAAE